MAPDGEWACALAALRLSLWVASLAIALALVPGCWIGWLLARRTFRGKSLVETLATLPLVLPPTAVGYGILLAFGRNGPLGESALGFDLEVVLTWKGAVLCSAIMALPLIVRTARVAFEGVDPRLEAMARSLGLSPARVLAQVTLPLARRGLAAAGLLGFSRALGEFGATVVVAGSIPGRTQTLALAIFDELQIGRETLALRLIAISTALAFACVLAVETLLARTRQGTVR